MTWKIPLSDIDLQQGEIDAVTAVLKSNWLSMGPVTAQFEEEFAGFVGVKHAFAVANGTAALHITCQVLGIGHQDEVIVPSLTFVATANAILYTRATPVFADITSLSNFNISPDDIIKKITGRTKAISVVHYGGYSCNMDAIMEIAEKHNLKVIEDAAHAPGVEYKGKKLGAIGDIGCFSFFSNKNMTTGEGGMIVTDNDSLAERIKTIRSHGMTTLTWDRHQGHAYSYDVTELGYNYRINEIASALGRVQLKKLKDNNLKREKITKEYIKRLKDVSSVSIPFRSCEGETSYHIFPVLLSEEISRVEFMEKMKQEGVQTSIYYPPIHLFSSYRKAFDYKEGMLPLTEFVGQHEITLPLYPHMKPEDIDYVCKAVNRSF